MQELVQEYSVALAQKIIQLGYTGKIHFVCYESDKNVLPVLISNLESMSQGNNITFEVGKGQG